MTSKQKVIVNIVCFRLLDIRRYTIVRIVFMSPFRHFAWRLDTGLSILSVTYTTTQRRDTDGEDEDSSVCSVYENCTASCYPPCATRQRTTMPTTKTTRFKYDVPIITRALVVLKSFFFSRFKTKRDVTRSNRYIVLNERITCGRYNL